MAEFLGTLAAVLLGGFLTIISSAIQRRQENRVRTQTWSREFENLRYVAFREYLTACNRFNALRIALNVLLKEGELDKAARIEFRASVANAQEKLQEAQPVYILVDEGSDLHTALKRMTREAHTLREKLESLTPVPWEENKAFRAARRSCELLMGNLVTGSGRTQKSPPRGRLRRL